MKYGNLLADGITGTIKLKIIGHSSMVGEKRNFHKRKSMISNRNKGKWRSEEISSDLDSNEETERNAFNAESDEETAHEKRYRLAKQYLNEVEREEREKADDKIIDREAIGHRLQEDAIDEFYPPQRSIVDNLNLPSQVTFRFLRGHKLSPTCCILSPDGCRIVSGSKDGDTETGEKLHVIDANNRAGHRSVSCLAVSSDQKFLCSGGPEKKLRVWDFETMRHLKTFTGHTGAINGVAIRNGYNQVFSCSSDKCVRVWDLTQMGFVDYLPGHSSAVMDIDCLARERAITCGGSDRTVRIWKVAEDSQVVFSDRSGCGSTECVKLINENHFVTGADNNTISLWSVFKRNALYVKNNAHDSTGTNCTDRWISALATFRHTDLVISGSCDGTLRFWKCADNLTSLKLKFELPVTGFINRISCASEANMIAAAVGQEHRSGRWWRIPEARNSILVFVDL
ncbi:U3 small nucleolar RNA-interacting protein 2 [Trichinella pseudospiralis]|uniref:U3 small nucleolar RNA-interacting protein 2 n=1 Tax=Trichinella pseudospiralis TaxID=6337 RepID=A0A0V1FAE1_TRIPS|nr:U3 small nucleolar RNA-interacting protein 2 [Trichinella pseudospiralis]